MGFLSFSYPVTRPYPYKWFKWVALIGGIGMLVVSSILNFSANGFDLVVKFTPYPNQTSAQKSWSQSFPLGTKTVPTCEPDNLQVNTQYFTDKLSLVYTVSNIWQIQNNNGIRTLPSLPYMYNPLVDCSVNMVTLDLSQSDGRTASQEGWTQWGIDATGFVTCSVVNNNGPIWLNLTVRYNFVPPTIESGLPFQFQQSPNNQTQASLWWAESLLSWYWLNLQHALSLRSNIINTQTSPEAVHVITKGSLSLWPLPNATDFTSLDFFGFNPAYHFVLQYNGTLECCLHLMSNQSLGGLHAEEIAPDIWIEADSFSKIFISAILADLGQNATSNIFTNESLLTTFSKNITGMAGTIEWPWLKAGPARTPYSGEGTGPSNLSLNSSVLYAQYLCQVPVLKSTGSLIISILIADLVFLHAAWAILNWITTSRLKKSSPAANDCAGCVSEGSGMLDVTDKSYTSTSYKPLIHGRLS